METVTILTETKKYPVFVGKGTLNHLVPFLKSRFPDFTSILIITDETVGNLYLSRCEQILSEFQVISKIVPAGEKAKTFDVYYECLTFALEKNLDRKSVILSFGGGAVGDLAGFVASTFMRGIPFIQIPTTILAHDSSVGGKVAINHPSGKNMIGSFYQPEAVFYDLNFLQSLSGREVRSGFAEIIKHALISEGSFYEWLRKNISTLENISLKDLQYTLIKGIKIKGSIVSKDEKETGPRAFLNFGHTLGHAIEAEMGYGFITHGEAVATGMVFALDLSRKLTGLTFDLRDFCSWMKELGYEIGLPSGLEDAKLFERMRSDKKSVGQNIRFVLLKQLGEPVLTGVSDDMLQRSLHYFRENQEEYG